MNSQKKITKNPNRKSESINFSTNSQLNQSNNTYAYNLKKSLFNQNFKYTKQKPIIHLNNNKNIFNNSINKTNKNIGKYKTAKNSPNKYLFKKENPKFSKYFNKMKTNKDLIKDNKKSNKLKPKFSLNNSIINKNRNKNKNILSKKKSKEKILMEEILKKKILYKNHKKSITTNNSNNNSISLNNTSYKNIQINSSEIFIPRLNFNNFNNGSKNKKIKEKLIESWEENRVQNGNINYSNFKPNSILLKNINSYREKDTIKKIGFMTDKHLKEKKFNYYGQTSKDFYIFKKYIESMLTNQPQRPKNINFSKSKQYKTIANKKIIYRFENEKNCLSLNRKSNTNKNKIERKKIQKNFINKEDYSIFVKSNFSINNIYNNIYKVSNTTKCHNTKELYDKNNKKPNKELKVKTVHSKQGQPIRLSSDNNSNNNQKITNKSISTNNYSNQNSEFVTKSNILNNKKADIDYHFINNNYFLKEIKKGFQNNWKDNKKKKIYSTNSSKEKINKKLILQKKNDLNKIFKNVKKNSMNLRTHNCSKEEINFKRNLSYKFKTPRQNIKTKKINVNKNIIFSIKIKKIKSLKSSPTKKNKVFCYGNNKMINYKVFDKYSGSNSKIEINKKKSFTKINESIKTNKMIKNKLEEINKEKNNKNNKINEKLKDNKIKSKEFEIKDKRLVNKKDNKKKNKIPDKDLSDIEEDISLLNYLNNNIDNLPNSNIDNSIINSSSDSIHSVLKDNNKYLSFKKSKEIISNYIKQYYLKHNKYPKTKMKFYKYGRLLGKGAYGKVNVCLHALTGRLVAIKSINKSKITKEKQKQKIILETSIMKALSESNNVVKFFETFETKKHICIVMEYICAGDLLSYIKKRSKLTETVSKSIFKQIILALQYIHSHNIVHRDIKLDNILIDLDNNIKICDFGVSKIIKKGDIMLEQCGTPAYIAPEILRNRGYEGFGVDIWSAGVVLYAMLSGTVPFKGGDLKELHQLIIEGEFKIVKNVSKEANHLLKCLLQVDPKNRIKIEDILVHPWMINVDLNLFMTKNLFTNAENILLANSNVDYTDINKKENMVENFDIKNLDTEEENVNCNIKTKSFILAPFNSSITSEENEEDSNINEDCDFRNPDLLVRNNIIKFSPKAKELNRNYELNNNKEIDNGIIILSYDSEEKDKKDNKSPYEGSYNSKFHSKQFSPIGEIEVNSNKNNININKKNNDLNFKILEKMKVLGYEKDYAKKCSINKEFNYATATYKLLEKYCYNE